MFHRTRRPALAVLGALLLSSIIAGQVLAAHSWSGPIPITSSGSGFANGVVGLNSTTAVAIYVEWNGDGYNVALRRSTTSGSSWDTPLTLSTNGYDAAISGVDPYVDAVWTQHNRVRYARSSNGGVSFDPSVALTNKNFPINLSVARGPGGLVIAAWQNGNNNTIRTRVSTDGGVSFGPPTAFASHVQDMGTTVAAGDGVVYLAYKTRATELQVTRSTDGGVSWSSPVTVTTNAYGVFDNMAVTASGTHAYLAYTILNASRSQVVFRRTIDSGTSWSSEMALAPTSWKTATPDINLQGGVVRAVYERHTSAGYGVYYQQSSNGVSWASPELVDASGFDPFVTKAGNLVVLYTVGAGDATVRTGN